MGGYGWKKASQDKTRGCLSLYIVDVFVCLGRVVNCLFSFSGLGAASDSTDSSIGDYMDLPISYLLVRNKKQRHAGYLSLGRESFLPLNFTTSQSRII